ncbi:MAG TPA: Hpt domain-containing protein, partial [Verrucomicrobiae bacterium]|nr:Hpt domain-containing protein [Verrucomicrobiae bacterium]
MNSKPPQDLSQLSMRELFRIEENEQTGILTHGLLALERAPRNAARLETLMRAAHSLKGAARIVNIPDVVTIAHAMEDCLVAAQHGKIVLSKPDIDVLLRGIDLIQKVSQMPDTEAEARTELAREWVVALKYCLANRDANEFKQTEMSPERTFSPVTEVPEPAEAPERVLRLTAENLNRLLALAGESLVESRWLRPFSDSMERLRRLQDDVGRSLDGLRGALDVEHLSEHAKTQFNELFQHLSEARGFLGERLQDLDSYDRRASHLAHRLYLEVLRARMRPFGDGAERFPRMIRDIAHSL